MSDSRSRRDFRGAFDSVRAIHAEESRELRPARLGSFDLNLYRLDLDPGGASASGNEEGP